jgi:Lon protease-like protein
MSTAAIELPLFPLDVVLFPGTALPLHIFEKRYREMIAECLREDKPFGVVLINPDESVPLLEIPYSVGTMAIIRDVEELDDGRYNLVAIGTTRFRIKSQHRDKSYLCGMVEPFEDEEEPEEELVGMMQQARMLFCRYLELLLYEVKEDEIEEGLPDNPEILSHFVAYILDVHNDLKQSYLEMTSTRQRLLEEIAVLRREVPFMRQILSAKLTEDRARLN